MLNDQLRESADKANTFANILHAHQRQSWQCQLCADARWQAPCLALNGYLGLTLGTLVVFPDPQQELHPADHPDQPAAQQHCHGAGRRSERIFDLMDEEPEEDDGYVTLVNVQGGTGRHC